MTSIEFSLRYVPWQDVYETIFFHEGDYSDPQLQQRFLQRYDDRIAIVRASGEPELADKMVAFRSGFDFVAIDVSAPVAALNIINETPPPVWAGRWPGELASSGLLSQREARDAHRHVVFRVPLNVPLLRDPHL